MRRASARRHDGILFGSNRPDNGGHYRPGADVVAGTRVHALRRHPGKAEAVADLVVQETAGVAGQVTTVGVLFSNASTTIDGPFEIDPRRFGVTSPRIAAGGTLTMPELGIHFPGRLRDQLPATLRFTVNFRDDNGHTISSEVSILITPP